MSENKCGNSCNEKCIPFYDHQNTMMHYNWVDLPDRGVRDDDHRGFHFRNQPDEKGTDVAGNHQIHVQLQHHGG